MKTEMENLIDYLYKNVDGEKYRVFTRPCLNGQQVVVTDKDGKWLWDAVCHSHSYGGNRGLLEVMEQSNDNYVLTEDERACDDVLGWLTAEDIIKRLES